MLSKHELRKIRWKWRQATRARATVRAVVMHRRLRSQAGKKGATYSRGQPRQALVHRWAHALVMEVGLFCWPEEEKLLLACTRRPQGANKHRHGCDAYSHESVARTYVPGRKAAGGPASMCMMFSEWSWCTDVTVSPPEIHRFTSAGPHVRAAGRQMPNAAVGGVSPVPAPMWHGRAQLPTDRQAPMPQTTGRPSAEHTHRRLQLVLATARWGGAA
jgi:hypothetical protein